MALPPPSAARAPIASRIGNTVASARRQVPGAVEPRRRRDSEQEGEGDEGGGDASAIRGYRLEATAAEPG
jgi:hypothetical protein